MNAAEILSELLSHGIQLEVNNDRIRFYPREAVTPAMLGELRTHKSELLALLRAGTTTLVDTDPYEAAEREAIQYEARESDARLAMEFETDAGADLIPFGPDGWPINTVEPFPPCPCCGGVDYWQTLTNAWLCMKCDPMKLFRFVS